MGNSKEDVPTTPETVKFLNETKVFEDGKKRPRRVYEFEQILDVVGSNSKFQKLLIYGFVCPFSFLLPIFALCTVFMLSEPNHWCHVPGKENGNYSIEEWKKLVLPEEMGPDGRLRFSQCKMYGNDANRSEIPCMDGWEYDMSDYRRTIPSSNDWVCEKAHYAAQAFTAASVGNVPGTILYGYLGDKIGRKIVFMSTIVVHIIARAASLFLTHDFYWYLGMQFLVGTSYPMMYISSSTIIAEICDKEYRSWIFAASWISWVLGISLVPLFAWLLGDWYTLGLLSLVPLGLSMLYFIYIPESPRWYVSVGKLKEAEGVLTYIAEVNGTLPNIQNGEIFRMLTELKERQGKEDHTRKQGVWTLFTMKRVAIRTILLSVVWAMNSLVYLGITLNATSMAGNQFLNFFLLSIVELPTGWLGGYLVENTGRRWTQVVFFMLSMVGFLFAAVGAYIGSGILTIVAIMLSKFSVAITTFVVTLQAMEVFPTQLRSTGTGFASTVGAAAAIATPLIVYLGKIHILIPYLSLAVMSFLGSASSALLPETYNQSLPETMEDANNLGKNAKFLSFLPGDYKPKRRRSSLLSSIVEFTHSTY